MLSAVSSPTARGNRCVPPAPGSEAELHLGQADLRAACRDAVVRAQRQLEAAAEREAIDRDHHRLAAALERGDHGRQASAPAWLLRRVEFADVGAAENTRPAPVMTTARTALSLLRVFYRIGGGGAHGRAHAVDGRVVERHHEYGVAQFEPVRAWGFPSSKYFWDQALKNSTALAVNIGWRTAPR